MDKILHKFLGIPYKLSISNLYIKENSKATIVFVHGLASSKNLWKEFESHLPKDVDILTIDLLGHGKSPKPLRGDAQELKNQARSIRRTLLKIKDRNKPIILVGHSLGALVSAEFAFLYPNTVNAIILLSPPIYRNKREKQGWRERILKKYYQTMINHPDVTQKMVEKIAKTSFINGGTKIKNKEDFLPLINSLEYSIVNQNSFLILKDITIPTKIIYGAFDPVVIGKNIKELEKSNKYISATLIPTWHDVSKIMMRYIRKTIKEYLKES